MTSKPLEVVDVAGSDDDRRRGVAHERASAAARLGMGDTGLKVRASTTQGGRADAGPLAIKPPGAGSDGETWISVGDAAARTAVNSAIIACIKRLYA